MNYLPLRVKTLLKIQHPAHNLRQAHCLCNLRREESDASNAYLHRLNKQCAAGPDLPSDLNFCHFQIVRPIGHIIIQND